MNQPTICNLDGRKGDTFHAEITLKNPDNTLHILPTGGTWRAVIRETPDSRNAITEFYVSVSNNKIILDLTSEQASHIDAGVWDLEFKSTTLTKTYLQGLINLSQDVTR